MRRYTLTIITLISALIVAAWLASAEAQTGRTVIDHPNRFAANVADVGATLTEIGAAITGQAYYVTGIVLVSSTSTGGTFAIRAGTGANCATNPVGVWPQPGVASPTLTYPYPANTAAPYVIQFSVPIKAAVGSAICLVGTATNLARGAVLGFTAP
jgi:hypothetical protein